MLRTSAEPAGVCSAMPRVERVDQKFESLRGGVALRSIITSHRPRRPTGSELLRRLGFRILDYMVVQDQPVGVFLHAKDSQYDVVFIRRPGPALHHFAYVVSGINEIMRACDVAGAWAMVTTLSLGRAGTVWGIRTTYTCSIRTVTASNCCAPDLLRRCAR